MKPTHSKTYYCSCGWSGWFPNVVRTEKKEGNLTTIAFIAFCPDCDHEFTFEEHAK